MTENESIRLTTDKKASEMGMYELALNCCYIKDGLARYRDFSQDWDARELTRKLLKHHAEGDDAFTCDDDFDECMIEYLQYGKYDIEGFIALFYRNLWAMAELRENLKEYEDIGTVEEFKALKETGAAKKVKGIRFTVAVCPKCESELFETYWAFGGIHYCSNCGQAIDWND